MEIGFFEGGESTVEVEMTPAPAEGKSTGEDYGVEVEAGGNAKDGGSISLGGASDRPIEITMS